MHLGSALVAVANAAFAKAMDGELLLRIDDTDAARSREEDSLDLLRMLRWLGIEWDEGPIYQHERAHVYTAALTALEGRGDAYPCFCGDARLTELRESQKRRNEPPRYDGRCRELDPVEAARSIAAGAPHVLRFAVPAGRDVEIDDLVHGRVIVPSGSFGDPVLCRSDGSAGYLLASVADDLALHVTHVIRGEDHLHNTARQLLLFEALGGQDRVPRFAHLPLLRDEEGRKLSKRDPLGTLEEIVDEGFLPTSIRRYLAELLGQGPVDLLAEDGPEFQLPLVTSGAPRVDRVRLESLGREDMAELPLEQLVEGTALRPEPRYEPIMRELAALSHSHVHLRGELRLVFDGPGPGDLPHVLHIVAPDPARMDGIDAALELWTHELRTDLEAGAGDDGVWAAPFLQRARSAGSERGLGTRDMLQPLRIALTGTTGGPGLDLVLTAIGAREALRRVHLARVIIEELRGGERVAGG
ncbi:MAG: glutamate--tRNA ligase [Thermoleophilia bacterium]|nr:glutamate--tRNA ligase [Thermoleophilia bacterium]MCZ4495742.1 glutamate--tRNA ligase [Thermoleophilia bacterium]